MKEAIKPKNWCNSPYYVREISDLYRVGSRVDAWREFLLSEAIEVLRGLNMSVCSFNQYSMFDQLILMLDCSEESAIAGIRSIMRRGYEREFEFRRDSIFDERAWAYLPLSCFADAQGFNERDQDQKLWPSDILKINPMPEFMVGIRKEWVVPASSFTFSHKIKVDKKNWPVEKKRFAQVAFDHLSLDRRFEGNQHVSSGIFPVDRDIAAIREELMAQAMVVCAKHAVTVQEEG
jgi:hypothetical protein